MKYLEEYRDAQAAKTYKKAIAERLTQPWTLMEICGGQTHSIIKYGIDSLLPPTLNLVHGPGCPVCVTSAELIEQAITLASQPDIIFCSFGDMLRVPGKNKDLLTVKALGGDVRIVYSPLDCLKIAANNRTRQIIFFAVGFETTAPATAMLVYQARKQRLENLSLLVSHVLVPPAIEALLSSPKCRIQGFLAAGHVCTVMGYTQYEPLAKKFHIPIVVTGFEPLDILQGVYMCIQQLEEGRAECENQYKRSVKKEGNEAAITLIQEVFEVIPQKWRGLGEIPASGLALRDNYIRFDAQKRFGSLWVNSLETPINEEYCISGKVLQGLKKPHECPEFGKKCTPEHPLGAPMVSSEGACAAYYRYRQYAQSTT